MHRIGTVSQVWRYPVKSMAGERLECVNVGAKGIPGDRGWALRDERVREIRGAKKLPQLMLCAAQYLEEPGAEQIPHVEITLPDGGRVRSGTAEAEHRLSELCHRELTLWPIQPADALDHYRRRRPDNPDLLVELREMFGRLEGEPLPDLSGLPKELFRYTSPLGTYFDAYPVHLVTTSSLSTLARVNPRADFDVRRFRPNFLIDTGTEGEGLLEREWVGRRVRVGHTVMHIEMACMRCVMITLPQKSLPKDPGVLRSVVHDAGQNLGVYASVVEPGRIEVGDAVMLQAA